MTNRRMTLKSLLSGLFALTGAGAASAPRTVDPKSILFSVPTLSDDISPQEPPGAIGAHDLVFHEDDWRQIEFYPRSRLEEVRRTLGELKKFEGANRAQFGWRNVYVRRLRPAAIVANAAPVAHLASTLRAQLGPAPVLFTGADTPTGRIAKGFTLRLGPKAWLYGASESQTIVVLGAHMEAGADDGLLAQAFMALCRSDHVMLVDWRQQLLLTDVDADGQIVVWRP